MTCIYVIEETDSLCPLMGGTAQVVALPGTTTLTTIMCCW